MFLSVSLRDGGTKRVRAKQLNAIFAAHRTLNDKYHLMCDEWTVTHIPTGWAVARVMTMDAARAIAAYLCEAASLQSWSFSRPHLFKRRFTQAKRREMKDQMWKLGGW